jgi:hypothetical protein
VRVERRLLASDRGDRWTSVPWQEEDHIPGESVRIEIGLSGDVRVVLEEEDLDHLRALIVLHRPLPLPSASEDYA